MVDKKKKYEGFSKRQKLTAKKLKAHADKKTAYLKAKKKKEMKKDSPEMGNEPKDGVIYQGRYKESLPKTGVNQPETVRNRMKKKKKKY